ncbi:MAG: hypothetical protein PWQ55_1484 [Chloroflexota bacterium]|nr:hypothetical protein [Chloroflexota bacterium]
MLLIVLACQVDFSNVDQNEISNAVAQTLEAKAAETAAAQPTAEPVQPTPAPTEEPQDDCCCCCDRYWDDCRYPYWGYDGYCNQARFINETIRDYSVFYPNEPFTKIWRLKNIGHCTWTTDYRLALQSGDAMGVRYDQYFDHEVKPGEYIDIAVDMRAPYPRGEYTSFWQLQDEYGRKFGQVYLIIQVR